MDHDRIDEVETNVVPDRRTLKNKQTAFLGNVTKKRNELTKLMDNVDNLHLVKGALDEYNELFTKYRDCFLAHQEAIDNEDEQDRESERYESKETSFLSHRNQVELWITNAEIRLADDLERTARKNVSHHSGSRHSRSYYSGSHHKGSTKSYSTHVSHRSNASEHVRAKARLAELLAEKALKQQEAALKQQVAALKQQESAIEIRRAEMLLDIEIAKAQARRKVLDEAEAQSDEHEFQKHELKDNSLDTVGYVNDVNVIVHDMSKPLSQCVVTNPVVTSVMSDNIQCIKPSYVFPATTHAVPSTSLPNRSSNSPTSEYQSNPQTRVFEPHANTLASSSTSFNDVQRQIRDIASAMSLPTPKVTEFSGNPIEFNAFMLAFDTRIASRAVNNADRLYYLHECLKGEPKILIDGCLQRPPENGYQEARELLQYEYGNPYKIANSYLNTLLDWAPIRTDDSTSLKQLSFFLIKCSNAMKSVPDLGILNHIPNLQVIIGKFPLYLQNKWRDKVSNLRTSEHRAPQFSDVVMFLQSAADAANDPAFSREALDKATKVQHKTNTSFAKPKAVSFAVNVESTPKHTRSTPNYQQNNGRTVKNIREVECYYCQGPHDIDNCSSFLHKSMTERRQFFIDQHRCFGCIGFNHISRLCLNKRVCTKCQRRHPTCLHIDEFVSNEHTKPHDKKDETAQESTTASSCATHSGADVILQAILPVYVRSKGDSHGTFIYAFYDPGSTGCFILEELADNMKLRGHDIMLQLKTMHGVTYTKTTAINDLIVSDINRQNEISLPKTYTRPEIPVEHNQIPQPEMLTQWPHLNEVANKMHQYNPKLQIGLLIGTNCPKALEPLSVIPMKDNSPFAVEYRHGWTINGPVQVSFGSNNSITSCNRIVLQEVEFTKEILSPAMILNILESDFNGCQVGAPNERGYSQEDHIFLDKATNNIQLVNGHYVIPLPFRQDDVKLPNNKGQAVKRALCQKRKMLKDHKYYTDYLAFINNILDKGYAMKIPSNKLQVSDGKVWYLPHHGVYNPRKPEKIRVVFDCSCKYNGISLNDCLIPGPDLTNSLVGVLTRFREHEVAFTGDIESMFHQVLVPESQHSFLRFLWWPHGNLEAELEEYCMTVHLFGAVSSPSTANFALRQITIDNEAELQADVIRSIQHHFYVDDCLMSLPTTEDACTIIRELSEACQKGGFHITKYTSNSMKVLKSITPDERSNELKNRDLDHDILPVEQTLGLQWCIKNDSFGFSIVLPHKPLTRRGVLSLVSAVFDPLGFAAPFILPAKKILQDLCKENIDWDDKIPEPQLGMFAKWLQDVPLLKNLKINRSLKPSDLGEILSRQIHVFADASSIGYGCVAYLRSSDNERSASSFLIGKSRLAPIKSTTIPRLELTAATVAIRLGEMMLKELDVPIERVVYHTDATTVLHYIRSQTKRFPIFVANRIRQILDYSTPDQWRYVDTSINPADIASRGVEGSKLHELQYWHEGPEFLCKDESEWPEQPNLGGAPHDIEILAAVTSASTHNHEILDNIIQRHSSWYKLKINVAVYITLKAILQDRVTKKIHPTQQDRLQRKYLPFSVNALQEAEFVIIKHVQQQRFSADIELLTQTVPDTQDDRGRVSKRAITFRQSQLYCLDPFMKDNLIRVGGRLSKANIPEDTKHPILLPKRSHVTTLIIRHAHEQLMHAGRNHVIARLRERYWIICINSAVRNYIISCVQCRRLRRPCEDQKMSDLPISRLEPAPPFTCTGVDLFGPFLIKEGRKEMKRYGVLYTCLVSRAIHLETVNSLETDSFLNSLQRFISRRGPVREIKCDNGTNFVGASRELRKALDELKHERIREHLLHQNIDWKFNPPTASHMGGSWERQIRSVKRVLSSLMHDHGNRLDDESLRTLLCQAEAIVNSRPLTAISNDVDDLTPLSPNQLLNLKPTMLPPPGNFTKEDLYAKKRWRRVQYLSDLFWNRWKREYIVNLQQRQKWNQPQRNMQLGDIVILKEDTTPRCNWPMARVIDIEQDKAGTVRAVKLKVQNSEMRRPIHKIVLLLPVDEHP